MEEIAAVLYISPEAFQRYRSRIYRRLKLRLLPPRVPEGAAPP